MSDASAARVRSTRYCHSDGSTSIGRGHHACERARGGAHLAELQPPESGATWSLTATSMSNIYSLRLWPLLPPRMPTVARRISLQARVRWKVQGCALSIHYQCVVRPTRLRFPSQSWLPKIIHAHISLRPISCTLAVELTSLYRLFMMFEPAGNLEAMVQGDYYRQQSSEM